MPEVTTEPGGYTQISELQDIRDFSVYTKAQLIQGIATAETNVLRDKPESEAANIRLAFDVIFGPYRLEAFHTRNTVQQVRLATIQHAMAHHLLYATSEKASGRYAQQMLRATQSMHEIVRRYSYETGERDIPEFLAGTRAESALVSTFLGGGYRVILPNYYEVGSTEVQEWDIEAKTDFVVVDETTGVALRVDVKSRSELTEPFDIRKDDFPRNGVPDSMAKRVVEAKGKIPPSGKLPRLVITLSTNRNYWQVPKKSPDQKETLESLLNLSPGIQAGIIEEIKPYFR